VERQPWDSQYWYRRLPREYDSKSEKSTIDLTDQKTWELNLKKKKEMQMRKALVV